MLTIRAAIYDKLKTVLANSFSNYVKQDTIPPYIYFRILDNTPSSTKDSVSHADIHRVAIFICHAVQDSLITLATSVRGLFENLSDSNFTGVQFDGEVDDYDYENELNIIRQDYIMRIKL